MAEFTKKQVVVEANQQPGDRLLEIVLAIPRMIMLGIRLTFDKDVPWSTKVALGAGLLYIVSPIDAIPDFIPVIGQLEDAMVALLLVDGIVNQVDRSIVMRHWRGSVATLNHIGSTARRITGLLPAFWRARIMRRAFSPRWQKAAGTK